MTLHGPQSRIQPIGDLLLRAARLHPERAAIVENKAGSIRHETRAE